MKQGGFFGHLSVLSILALIVLINGCSTDNTYGDVKVGNNDHSTDKRCEDLVFSNTVQLDHSPQWIEDSSLPRYCRVRGTIERRINFELRLPAQWNGRFVMAGCGGFCGALLPDKPGYSNSINEALKRGYAAISHDSGHQAESWETHWANDDERALELWAHAVLPVVTKTGLSITTEFYGEEPHHKYFSGCSNGGRLGLMAAQRYPDLFDGIAAGGAVFDLSGIAGLWGNWMLQQTTDEGKYRFPQSKVALIKNKVMAQCDTVDGQADNVITDPRRCDVKFNTLQCAEGEDSPSCLTGEQVEILNRLYGGVHDGKGKRIYPAAQYSSEHYSDLWLFGSEFQPAWGGQASTGYRQLLSNDLFAIDTTGPIPTDEMQSWISRSIIPAKVDAVSTKLNGLIKADTRLFIYQGWSDPLIIPEPIIDYYQQAMSANKQLSDNARLFMVPGMGHCWERPADAPVNFDPLLVVENWVEKDTAPDFIIATQDNSKGELIRSRPICAYPKVAQLIENQNPDVAGSYRCVEAE